MVAKLRLIIEIKGEELEITRMEVRGVVERQEIAEEELGDPKIFRDPDQVQSMLQSAVSYVMDRVAVDSEDQAGPPDAPRWVVSGGDRCPECGEILHLWVDPDDSRGHPGKGPGHVLVEWCPVCNHWDCDIPERIRWMVGLGGSSD